MSNLKNCSGSFYTTVRRGTFMSKKSILVLCTGLLFFTLFQSCGPSASEMDYREKSGAIADSVSAYIPGISTDTINGITHNFARSADLKLKVKNVLEASNYIEDLITKKGGYVSVSDLSSLISYNTSVKFKEDSICESTHYTTANSIILKIPNKQLDTVLREITHLALFVDYRRLKADDIKMTLYANSLAEKRYQRYTAALEKNTKDRSKENLNHRIKTEESLLEKQTLADNTRIDSYELADKVNYATLVIELYQPEQVNIQITALPPVIQPYSPSFIKQMKDSLLNGLELLKTCFLFILNSWGLIFFFGLLFFLIKKLRPYISHKFYSTK